MSSQKFFNSLLPIFQNALTLVNPHINKTSNEKEIFLNNCKHEERLVLFDILQRFKQMKYNNEFNFEAPISEYEKSHNLLSLDIRKETSVKDILENLYGILHSFGIRDKQEYRSELMESKFNHAFDLSFKNSHGKSKEEFIKCIIQDDETLNIYEKIMIFITLQGSQIDDISIENIAKSKTYEETESLHKKALNILHPYINGMIDKELIEHSIQNDKSLNQPEKILFLDLVQRAQDIIEKSNDWIYATYAIQNDEFLNQYEKIFALAILEKTYIEDQKRVEVLCQACIRINFLLDSNTYNTAEEKERFKREIIQNDETLTQEEKDLLFNSFHDKNERQCEFCKNFTDNFEYCEHCIQNYLRENFCNWTSEDVSIDELIQLCQQKTLRPNSVIEWISFKQFKNVIYRTSGGFASIYTAYITYNPYHKWDSQNQKLERTNTSTYVILKYFDNKSFTKEIAIHSILSTKCLYIVPCYGLTLDIDKKSVALVLELMKYNLRIRPGLVKEPRWYVSIMRRCWDAIPENRPTINEIYEEVLAQLKIIYTNQANDIKDSNLCENVFAQSNKQLFKKSQSKFYSFEDLPEPRNATEEEQEAYDIQQQNAFNSKDISTDMSFKMDSEALNIDIIN
ncbi:kinase-like domain-containing protein [Gigaspora margarita]|uniref:Kinase-like domain-containing protein n=1 Tax=Gigaspora margarita TaxID=4874 RepID=A0A8H4AMR8_GIGMA|nr:kinase-like domain-containing protein [Gigaspora margarita]